MNKIFNLNVFNFIFIVMKIVVSLSCKDENDKNVDWFIIYKPPKSAMESLESNNNGTDYVYLTSSEPQIWRLSPFSITAKDSMLGNTWKVLKQTQRTATYLVYNDDPPDPYEGSAVGHLKGYLAFDELSGYWIVHSIPNFGSKNNYEFPGSGLRNGQYAFCGTYNTSQLDEICNHLLYCNPYIYERRASRKVISLLGEKARTIFTVKPAFIRSPSFIRISKLENFGRKIMTTFAKDNQLNKDLFSDIIAPKLQTSFVSQTWRRGAGINLHPSCHIEFSVTDVSTISLTAIDQHNKKEIFSFSSATDHSKWAVSTDRINYWICFADLNRMKSQEKRGGGAICFQSKSVWRQFQNVVTESETCPIS